MRNIVDRCLDLSCHTSALLFLRCRHQDLAVPPLLSHIWSYPLVQVGLGRSIGNCTALLRRLPRRRTGRMSAHGFLLG